MNTDEHRYTLGIRDWRRMACLLLACCVLSALAAPDDDLQPDLNALRAKADAGSVTAQTQLADFFIAADDYTNAVIWYRKAAGQGDLTAQLSLASLLIAGRGAEKNPQEAAKWLRAAADRIENNRPGTTVTQAAVVGSTPLTNPPAKIPTNAIIITRTPAPPNTNTAIPVPPIQAALKTPPPPPVPSTNPPPVTRIQRPASTPEPVLQDVAPVLRPPRSHADTWGRRRPCRRGSSLDSPE